MYEETGGMKDYLKFIFPENIDLER